MPPISVLLVQLLQLQIDELIFPLWNEPSAAPSSTATQGDLLHMSRTASRRSEDSLRGWNGKPLNHQDLTHLPSLQKRLFSGVNYTPLGRQGSYKRVEADFPS